MKCPYVLNIYLPNFFSYMHHSCHTSNIKYIGSIWTTLYVSIVLLSSKVQIPYCGSGRELGFFVKEIFKVVCTVKYLSKNPSKERVGVELYMYS